MQNQKPYHFFHIFLIFKSELLRVSHKSKNFIVYLLFIPFLITSFSSSFLYLAVSLKLINSYVNTYYALCFNNFICFDHNLSFTYILKSIKRNKLFNIFLSYIKIHSSFSTNINFNNNH